MELVLHKPAVFCMRIERAILTRRYFFLYAQRGDRKIQGDMILVPAHSVFVERHDGIDSIHFYVLQDALGNRVRWPLYALIVRQLAAPAHLFVRLLEEIVISVSAYSHLTSK